MDRDLRDALDHGIAGKNFSAGSLIKVKDLEGKSPFDLYSSSVTIRTLSHGSKDDGQEADVDYDSVGEDSAALDRQSPADIKKTLRSLDGDELFTFGSNKNLTLGHKNEDDRTYPASVYLTRPDHLLHRS